MTFMNNHAPKCFDDLVFSNPTNAKILRQYAEGVRNNHLILHGPYGTAKSTSARIISIERMRIQEGNGFLKVHNGRTDPVRKNWEGVFGNPVLTKHFGESNVVVLDEVDYYSKKLREQLVAKLKFTADTVVMTTNNLKELENPLIEICEVVHLTQPTGVDFTDRALAILKEQGFNFSRRDVYQAMENFSGNFRDLEKFLQTFVINNQHLPSTATTISPNGLSVQGTQAKSSPASTSTAVFATKE